MADLDLAKLELRGRVADVHRAMFTPYEVNALIARVRDLERWQETVRENSPKRDLIERADVGPQPTDKAPTEREAALDDAAKAVAKLANHSKWVSIEAAAECEDAINALRLPIVTAEYEDVHVHLEGGGVLTLPLTHSGLVSPRFVVHVPQSSERAREDKYQSKSHGKRVLQQWSSQGSLDILAERRRQIEAEGWAPEHDDEHLKGEMAMAAACYALAGGPRDLAPALWPWPLCWWKPKAIRRNLVRAGALVLAEIERIDRAAIAKGV